MTRNTITPILFTITILLFITFSTTFAVLQIPDLHPYSSQLPISITTTTLSPGQTNTPFSYSFTINIPSTTNSYTYVPCEDDNKAMVAVIPRTTLTSATYTFDIINPTITTNNSNFELESYNVTDIYTEGHIYTIKQHIDGPTPFPNGLTITVTFPFQSIITNNPQDYFVLLFGCIFDTRSDGHNNKRCTKDNARTVYSSFFSILPSESIPSPDTSIPNAYQQPIATKYFAYNNDIICKLLPLSDDSIISQMTQADTIPTGAPFQCEMNYTIPIALNTKLTNLIQGAVEIIELNRYDENEFIYGYPIPHAASISFTTYQSLLNKITDKMDFFVNINTPTLYHEFSRRAQYTIRIRHADIATNFANFHFFSFPSYYTLSSPRANNPLNSFTGAPFTIISDCDLYKACLTPTPTPSLCSDDTTTTSTPTNSYVTTRRSLDTFQCHCGSLFTGIFCQYTWVPRQCEADTTLLIDSDCYYRTTLSPIRDENWHIQLDATYCASATPPNPGSCTKPTVFVGCHQIEPTSQITASSNENSFTTFILGSRIECSPYEPFHYTNFNSIQVSVYVIWDYEQFERSNIDELVYTATIPISNDYNNENINENTFRSNFGPISLLRSNSTVTIDLNNPQWFLPTSTVLINYPNANFKTVRFYVAIKPLIPDSTATLYSSLYTIQSPCSYYDSLCPVVLNYKQCDDFQNNFINLIGLTHEHCFCRDGFYRTPDHTCEILSSQLLDNNGHTCIVNNMSLECCQKYGLINEARTICDKYTDVQPQLTGVHLTAKNQQNLESVQDITLTQGDEITIEWSKLGNFTSLRNQMFHLMGNDIDDDNKKKNEPIINIDDVPLRASFWLFLTDSTHLGYKNVRLDVNSRFDQENLSSLFYSYDNKHSLYAFNITQPTHLDPFQIHSQQSQSIFTTQQTSTLNDNIGTVQQKYPYLLHQTNITNYQTTFTIPTTLPLSYSSLLVLSVQYYNTTTNTTQYLYSISKDQRIHTIPTCLSMSTTSLFSNYGGIFSYSDGIPVLTATDLCINGSCELTTGQCVCKEAYNEIFPRVTGNNHYDLCQANFCGSFECIHGICNPTTLTCDCEDGWEGNNCQINQQCNTNYNEIISKSIDEFQYAPNDYKPSENQLNEQNECSRYGQHERIWNIIDGGDGNNNQCYQGCTCFDNYKNPPYCDQCTITCENNTEPDLHNGCNQCKCNRYNEGQYCQCEKMPFYISIIYPISNSFTDDIIDPEITSNSANINNELRMMIVTIIQDYYQHTNSHSNQYIYPYTPLNNNNNANIMYKINSPYIIHYLSSIIQSELTFNNTTPNFRVNYINVTMNTDLNGLDNEEVIINAVPKKLQIQSIVIDLVLIDNCKGWLTNPTKTNNTNTKDNNNNGQINDEHVEMSNFVQSLSHVMKFIQNIRHGTTQHANVWGTYREYIQYHYEYVLDGKGKNKSQLLLSSTDSLHQSAALSLSTIVTPIIPSTTNQLQSQVSSFSISKFKDENLQLVLPKNTPLTLIQFDPIFYHCASGNTIPSLNNVDKSRFELDYILNHKKENIFPITPNQVEFSFDVELFHGMNHSNGFMVFGIIQIIIVALAILF